MIAQQRLLRLLVLVPIFASCSGGARNPPSVVSQTGAELEQPSTASENGEALRTTMPSQQELDRLIAAHAARLNDRDVEVRREASEALYDLCGKQEGRTTKAVPILVPCLADPDGKVRVSAEWGLRRCGLSAVPALVACLSSENHLVRVHAANALGNMRSEAIAAAGALLLLLDDTNAEVRGRAAWALGLVGAKDDQTIARLGRMAASDTACDRSSALHALGNVGVSLDNPQRLHFMRDRVVASLNDPDAEVRWSALYLLEALQLKPAEHLPLLVRGLDDSAERVAEYAARTLKELAKESDVSQAVPALARLLDRRDGAMRTACEALGAIGPPARSAVPALIQVLENDDLYVVAAAAKALWNIEQNVEKSLPALAALLGKDDPGVAETVCDVLCDIGPAAAPLTKQVVQILAKDDYDSQWAAADALGAIASSDPVAMRALIEALGHPSGIVRGAAVSALVKSGAPAVPLLVQSLREADDDRREWVADVIGRLGPAAQSAVEPLRQLIHHEKRDLRAWSAIALGKVSGSQYAVPVLIEILNEMEGAEVRRQAIEALIAIGPAARSSIPALRRGLADEDEQVREAANRALSVIGKESNR